MDLNNNSEATPGRSTEVIKVHSISGQENVAVKWPKEVEFHPSVVADCGPPKPWDKWTLDDFEIGKPLGEGAFGYVYIARTRKTKFIVALKVIHSQHILENALEEQITRETQVHLQLEHPNIVSMMGCFMDKNKSVFVLEYCPGGDVFEDLKSQPGRRYGPSTAATYLYQVADALEYLHGRNILHRDLKPENLLIGYYGEVKLSDFGWSIQITKTKKEERRKRKTICGTVDYLSPEMIIGSGYDTRADIWCLGVLLFEFLSGSTPFGSNKDENFVHFRIVSTDIVFPDCFQQLHCQAKTLIQQMLKKDPNERPSLAKIKTNPWIVRHRILEQRLLPKFQKFEHLLTQALKDVYVNA